MLAYLQNTKRQFDVVHHAQSYRLEAGQGRGEDFPEDTAGSIHPSLWQEQRGLLRMDPHSC